MLALLKKNSVPLVLQHKGLKLIIHNFRAFISKAAGASLAAKLIVVGAGPMVVASFPVVLTLLVYAHLHINCHALVSTLPNIDGKFQYIEAPSNDEAKIIVAPHTPKLLFQEFDETEVSSIDSWRCYFNDNCPGPLQRKSTKLKLKPKKYIPLSQRTKTFKDLRGPVNEIDEIDVNNVNYK